MAAETLVEAQPRAKEQREPTTDLIREAFEETRELVRLEVAMAREELKAEIGQARTCAMAFATAGVAALISVTMFLTAIALAFGTPWLAALIIAVILLVVAGVTGWVGWKRVPSRPLGETKGRVEADLKQLKEHIA